MSPQDIFPQTDSRTGSPNSVPDSSKNSSKLASLSRRGFLAAGSAAALLGLAGCASDQSNASSSISNLPRGFLPADVSTAWNRPDTGYAPPANFVMPPYHPPVQRKASPVVEVGSIPIIQRSAWALAGPNMRTIQPMAGVRLITFHHTGDPKPVYDDSYAGSARYWELIRESQRRDGFEDIGYHFGIDRAGRVWQLRELKYRGEHVRDGFAPPRWLDQYRQYRNSATQPYHGRYVWNAHNIGVVSLGNFMVQSPTAQQKRRIVQMGLLLRRLYQIPIYHCYTHQELVATECPGKGLQPYMEYIRRNGIL